MKQQPSEKSLTERAKKEKLLNCPRCSTTFSKFKMRKLIHPKGIILDVCDNCAGMWVDGNEIATLYGNTEKEFLASKKSKKKSSKLKGR